MKSKLKFSLYDVFICLTISTLVLAGCPANVTPSTPTDSGFSNDWDGDGLSNSDEINLYHTNPYDSDTDGDGFNDYVEVKTMFQPNTNRFNPLLADTPEIQLEITKTPSIYLIKTYSDSSSESVSITDGESESSTSTRSNSNARTKSWEGGFTVGASFTKNFNAKSGPDASLSVNASTSWKWLRGNTTTFSSSEAQTIAQSYAETKAKSATKTENYTGAAISVKAKIKNTSNVAYTIDNIMLEAYKISYGPSNEQTSTAATNLYYSPSASDPTKISATIAPGGETGEITFSSGTLSVAAIESIMNGLVGFDIGFSTMHISSDDTKDFTKITTAVDAKTALLTVDYGPCFESSKMPIAGQLPETKSFQVATKRVPNSLESSSPESYNALTLSQALEDCLPNVVKYYTDSNGNKMIKSIYDVEGKSTNPDGMEGDWFIALVTYDNGLANVKYYGPSENQYYYNADNIIVCAGDDITVMYSVDKDKDGIPLREEELFGTSDDKTDTDGDTISDFDELTGWTVEQTGIKTCTNPVLEDTDGDGLNDNVDPYPTISAVLSNAYIEGMEMSYNPFNSVPYDRGESYFNVNIADWGEDVMKNAECEILNLNSIDSSAINSDGKTQIAYTLKGRTIPSSGMNLSPKLTHGSATYKYYLIEGWAQKDDGYDSVEGVKDYGSSTYAGLTQEEYNNKILVGSEETLQLQTLPVGEFKIALEVTSSDESTHVWYVIRFDSPLEVPFNAKAGLASKDGDTATVALSWAAIKDSRATNVLIVRKDNLDDSFVPEHSCIINAENSSSQGDADSSEYYMIVETDKTSYSDEVNWSSGYWYYFYTYCKDIDSNSIQVSALGSPVNAISDLPETFSVTVKFDRLTITDDFGDEGHTFELKWTIWQQLDDETEKLVLDHDQEWEGDFDNVRKSNWYSLANDDCTASFTGLKKNMNQYMRIHVRLREVDDEGSDDDFDNVNFDLFYNKDTNQLTYDKNRHNTGADSRSSLEPQSFEFAQETQSRFYFDTRDGEESVAGYFDMTILWAK